MRKLLVFTWLMWVSLAALADPRLKIMAGSVSLDSIKRETTTVTFVFDDTVTGFTISDILVRPVGSGELVGPLTESGGVYSITFRKLTALPSSIRVENNTFTNLTGVTGYGDSIGFNVAPVIYRNASGLFNQAKERALGVDGLPPRCPVPGEVVLSTLTGLRVEPAKERFYELRQSSRTNMSSYVEIGQGCMVRLAANQKWGPDPAPKSWDAASPHGAHRHDTLMPAITVEEFPQVTGTSDSLVAPTNHDCVRAIDGTPISGHCDATGAFRTVLPLAKYGRDDPMVYPGQKGASHHHTFFGNISGNHNSTTASLLENCLAQSGRTNCTLYWQTSMVDTTTKRVIKPDLMLVYYKASPAGNAIGATEKFPQGLKMLIGGPNNTTATDPHVGYRCFNRGTGAGTGGQSTIPSCKWPEYTTLEMTITFPQCVADNGSGGMVLDSPNHRSHLAYASNPSIPEYPNAGSQMYGNNHPETGTPVGRTWCPQSHPHLIPFIEQIPVYPIKPGQDTATWRLSADNYSMSLPGGYSGHADWWGVWLNYYRDRFVDQCNNMPIDCGTGYIGLSDGLQITNITATGSTATITTAVPHQLTPEALTTLGGAPFTLNARIQGITGPEAEKFNFNPTDPRILRTWNDPYEGPKSAVVPVGLQPLTVVSPTQLSFPLSSAVSSGSIAAGLNLTNALVKWGETLCILGDRGCVPSYYKAHHSGKN